ncbi:MAG: hypothetical protein ABH828_04545 [archaeon]
MAEENLSYDDLEIILKKESFIANRVIAEKAISINNYRKKKVSEFGKNTYRGRTIDKGLEFLTDAFIGYLTPLEQKAVGKHLNKPPHVFTARRAEGAIGLAVGWYGICLGLIGGNIEKWVSSADKVNETSSFFWGNIGVIGFTTIALITLVATNITKEPYLPINSKSPFHNGPTYIKRGLNYLWTKIPEPVREKITPNAEKTSARLNLIKLDLIHVSQKIYAESPALLDYVKIIN